ncbi:protein FLOWERING LOCUS D [Impatiens glandulifera]|uniref:protein FLOWERING LOCUS D n=1 Tax=Impatiens glandulifera TaxID=253017 RepID=UPI001FB06D74|nr:protein FLOWERING LOCUS D [Impatiens glandulifera]
MNLSDQHNHQSSSSTPHSTDRHHFPALAPIPDQHSTFNPNPSSAAPPSNADTNWDDNNTYHFPSVFVPKRRRRGRSRNASQNNNNNNTQVLNFPSFLNGVRGNGHWSSISSSPASFLNSEPTPNPEKTLPDVSDDIILINKETMNEAMTALSAGFPADILTDEEKDARVVSSFESIEQVNYIVIRNHIITKWRENVTSWVSKEMFFDVIPPQYRSILDSAYNYLVSHGYINFGVTPVIKEKIPSEPTMAKVIVLGAGLAGLAAARQLMRFGFKVTVLEGRKRAGGRVYTRKLEGSNKTAAADLGGSVLTSTFGNPLGILARQMSYSLHKVKDKCPLYGVNGKPVDSETDSKVEETFNSLLDKASHLRQSMGEVSQDVSLGSAMETFWEGTVEETSLFNWHLANLEYANAGLLSNLSLAFWDQDDPFDMGGDHCFLFGGNGKLIDALTENVPIQYEKTVHTVTYGTDGVQVIAGNQVFEGDVVLCTVPLGVLKSGSIKFIPQLPQRKLDGIKRLGFGLLNKVAMLFPYAFWGTDLDTFGHLSDNPSDRGEFFLFYSYATVAGGPLLIALVAGEAAQRFENMPPPEAVTRVLLILRGIYEPQGIQVPDPIQTVCTRWGGDPFSLGSYSNVAVGASGDDYDILAESVGDGKVFFAGEATMKRYPATMHGAFLSGLREAANILQHYSGKGSRVNVGKNTLKNAHSCASLLADLFREPDLEFGSFAVIFAQEDSDPKAAAFLRVTFGDTAKRNNEGSKSDQRHNNKLLFQQLQSHFNQQQEFHIYTMLSKEQALELREVRGGDEMRLHYLTEKLGVKLIGRKGLGPNADDVIASIKAERGKRKSSSTSQALKSGMSMKNPPNLKPKSIRKAKILRNSNGSIVLPNIGMGDKVVGKLSATATVLNTGLKNNIVSNGHNNNVEVGVPICANLNIDSKEIIDSGFSNLESSLNSTYKWDEIIGSSSNNGGSFSPISSLAAEVAVSDISVSIPPLNIQEDSILLPASSWTDNNTTASAEEQM